ncbi:hypothetical protein AB0M43_02185 [Longispora sp. NPDC051575]|uniref:hypothetical protein n=1 Tax=Longispora sp. NPDC051575 TaxID=3154943 RepID=UPI00342EF14E
MRKRWTWAAVAAAVVVAAAGCGSSPGPGSKVATGGGTPTVAASAGAGDMMAFARCMREHGVPMVDPQPGRVGEVGAGTDRATTEKAQKACEAFLPPVDARGTKPDPKLQGQMLAYAKCMRDNGVDYPDPVFDPNGGMSMAQAPGVSADDPKVRAAMKQCDKIMLGTSAGGTP